MAQTRISSVQHASIQLMDAWKRRDFATLNDQLHKDFQFVSAHINGYRYNKLQWLEVALNKYKIFHFRYEFLNVTDTDDVAVCISRLHIISSVSFKEQPNSYLLTDIWKNALGTWKLFLRQPVLII